MNSVIIELFIVISFILVCYHCCIKGTRERGYDRDHDESRNHEDLRRFRERLSERAAAQAQDGNNGDDSDANANTPARKELIEKNLFSRTIQREESVKELSRLLAISRGGVVDEELGLGGASTHAPDDDDAPASGAGDEDSGGATCSAGADHSDLLRDPNASMTDALAASESSMPSPSAPASSLTEVATTTATTTTTTTTDTIATALSSAPSNPPAATTNIPPKLNPITLEPIRNLWSNLTHNIQNGSERSLSHSLREMSGTTPVADESGQTNNTACPPVVRKNSFLNTAQKLECSICLDQYSPNDTICWAKDGGDPPTLSSASVSLNNDMGCDHIFHKECIVAWLQDHDECPLCRRKVVHMDPDTRFAGWEM
eukprot:CAMPEP_0196134594 /NCGR_PEP_ID=MMETSP0910-20130528/3462_1 /TAXON_ID=49265 /ORGANISM="Thalassiosira rotula, Strain GSO102" /LENGTH=372 /DNA_ID=CAMNT_0041394557 /DNA_START=120 /DNA_END=1238 /DNA_ORIENTATION=+